MRLGWKYLEGENALAYFAGESTTRSIRRTPDETIQSSQVLRLFLTTASVFRERSRCLFHGKVQKIKSRLFWSTGWTERGTVALKKTLKNIRQCVNPLICKQGCCCCRCCCCCCCCCCRSRWAWRVTFIKDFSFHLVNTFTGGTVIWTTISITNFSPNVQEHALEHKTDRGRHFCA